MRANPHPPGTVVLHRHTLSPKGDREDAGRNSHEDGGGQLVFQGRHGKSSLVKRVKGYATPRARLASFMPALSRARMTSRSTCFLFACRTSSSVFQPAAFIRQSLACVLLMAPRAV